MTVDYLWRDEANFRAGLVLVPMGFVNEIHEPTFFFGAERPEVERRIMPSTWRENGVGVFGRLAEEALASPDRDIEGQLQHLREVGAHPGNGII